MRGILRTVRSCQHQQFTFKAGRGSNPMLCHLQRDNRILTEQSEILEGWPVPCMEPPACAHNFAYLSRASLWRTGQPQPTRTNSGLQFSVLLSEDSESAVQGVMPMHVAVSHSDTPKVHTSDFSDHSER